MIVQIPCVIHDRRWGPSLALGMTTAQCDIPSNSSLERCPRLG